MSKISKKDRDEAYRMKAILAEDGNTDCEVIKTELKFLKIRAKKKSIVNYDLAGIFHQFNMYFISKAILERLINEDISEMIRRIRLSARFGYLNALTGGDKYSGGYDCSHVFSLIKALAVHDKATINAFLNVFPSPFSKGHQSTVLLCNGVYAALGHYKDVDGVLKKLRNRKESKFFRAMYDCLIGVISNSEKDFLQGYLALLKGNRRQDFHSRMEKIICIEAHAMYFLLVNHSKISPTFIDLPVDFPWDCKLQNKLEQNEENILINLSEANLVLENWINRLPTDINAEELLNSLG